MNITQENSNAKRLLDILEEEISDAKIGIGKPLAEIENFCQLCEQVLGGFEQRIDIAPSFRGDLYPLQDMDVNPMYKKIFVQLIDDLYLSKIVTYKEALERKENQAIVSTRPVHEMFAGKNIVVKNKKELRLYRARLKIMINSIHENENIKTSNKTQEKTSHNEKWWKEEQKPSLEKDYEGGPVIRLGEKICQIPDGSNQYILCEAVFLKPIGVPTKEIEVIDKFFRGGESQQSFYDSVRGLNKRIKISFGIKLLKYKASKTWIDADLFK